LKIGSQSTDQVLQYYTGKRILVTGASGYLATNLIDALKDVNCTIIRLSRSDNSDICSIQTWDNVLEDIDVIFHFAAQTSVYVAEENPIDDLRINVVPMLNLLQTCRKKNVCPIVIFSGTVTQAGIPKNLPVNESCKDRPVTIYDLHKLIAEKYLKHYCQKAFVRGASLRLANVYGPGPKSSSSDRGVINMMMRKALAGEPLIIYGKGDYLRDYIYVDDVIAAFLRTPIYIEQLNGKHFVLGSGQGHTITEAVNLIAERVDAKTKQQGEVKHIEPPTAQSPIEARNFVADTQLFAAATGWRPHYSLQKGIDQTLDVFLKHDSD